MTKHNLKASLFTEKAINIKCKTPEVNSKEVSEKLGAVNEFMEERKKWEKGLFTSKTIIK